MSELNVANRTLAIMDNLPFLRALNNECIDLIAIDPPFAANETFTQTPKPPITEDELAEEKALAEKHGVSHNEGIGETRVKDFWNWDDDIHPAWKMQLEDDYPAVHAVVQAVEACATENEAAYIAFMAVRLIECRRVLKPTGSIYVHCDDHANSYLRILMDAIFGADNFRNEISWRRTSGRSDANRYGRVRDSIIFYAKTDGYVWNSQYRPHDEDYIRRQYRHDDKDGRGVYQLGDLTARGLRNGESGQAWSGVDPSEKGRHWRTPTKGGMNSYIVENDIIPGWPNAYPSAHDRLDALNEAGLIYWPVRGSVPRLKQYYASMKGVAVDDIFDDIKRLEANSSEKTGYATQKPLALYERIIKASSNPGDVVLDIFAGCATTAIAAENLKRQWIACDMAYRSWTMLKRRFYLAGFALTDMTDSTREALGVHQTEQQDAESYTIGPDDLPIRTDTDPAPFHPLAQTRRGRRSAQSASWSGRIPKDEAKQLLIDRFGPVCWGCGYEPRRPNGTLDDMLLEVDHIRAKKASEGKQGDDELYNLALLHRTCNGIKRNKLTLEELRSDNALNGRLYVNTMSDLVDLFEAQQYAVSEIMKRSVRTALAEH